MTDAAEPTPMYVLEAEAPLAKSMVWHIQRTFYADQGVEAWSRSQVPQSVTTSPVIARAYARMVHGYLQDVHSAITTSEPLYVVELGAGTGRFAYRFLKAFEQLPAAARLVYVMTDASPSVVEFWRTHPRLQPYVQAGRLDFAHFDLLEPAPLQLQHAGQSLQTVNPIVLIGNYIFDSIPQDAYSVRDGKLFASLVTVSASTPELDLTAPDSRVRLHIGFTEDDEPADLEMEPDPILRDILGLYRDQLDATSVVIPRAAMACLRFFSELGGGRLLCLASDFGDASLQELAGHGPPGFGAGGGLWLAVNFHALGEYARGLGGYGRHPRQRALRLNTSMLLVDPRADASFAATELAYDDTVEHLGPDVLAQLLRSISEHSIPLDVEGLVAVLRATGWDTDYMVRCVPPLVDALPQADRRLRRDVLEGAKQAWEQFYPLGNSEELPFALGVLLFTLEHYAEAIAMFEQAPQDTKATLNLALSHYRLGRLPEALHWLDRTLELDPANEQALSLRRSVAAELGV